MKTHQFSYTFFIFIFFTLANIETRAASFNLGEWDINYPQSYLAFKDIQYKQMEADSYPQLDLYIDQAIVDFLFFASVEDIFKYSIRVEDTKLKYITLQTEEPKAEKLKEDEPPSKFQYDKINLPFTNIIHELFFPSIDLELINVKGESREKMDVYIQDLKMSDVQIFKSKDKNSNYSKFSARAEALGGKIKFKGKGHPLLTPPLLDLDLEAKGLKLTEVSKHLTNSEIDFEQGTADIRVYFVTKNKKLEGQLYFSSSEAELVKGWNDNKSLITNLQESFLDMGLEIFDQTEEDLLEGKIRFSGNIDEIDWNYWNLIKSLFDYLLGQSISPDSQKFNLPLKSD